jgi:hypothetical protein
MCSLHHGVGSAKQQGACEIHYTALTAPTTKNAVFWEVYKRFGVTSHFSLHSSLPQKGNGFLPDNLLGSLNGMD